MARWSSGAQGHCAVPCSSGVVIAGDEAMDEEIAFPSGGVVHCPPVFLLPADAVGTCATRPQPMVLLADLAVATRRSKEIPRHVPVKRSLNLPIAFRPTDRCICRPRKQVR